MQIKYTHQQTQGSKKMNMQEGCGYDYNRYQASLDYSDFLEIASDGIEKDFLKAASVNGWLYLEAKDALDADEFKEFLENESSQREWFFESATGYNRKELSYWFKC